MRTGAVIVLALVACATGAVAQYNSGMPSGVGIWPERDLKAFADANDKYQICFAEQATKLDDDRSDARTIAAAVYAACWKAKIATLQATGGMNSTDAINRALQASRDEDIDRASIAVLEARNAKRALEATKAAPTKANKR